MYRFSDIDIKTTDPFESKLHISQSYRGMAAELGRKKYSIHFKVLLKLFTYEWIKIIVTATLTHS